MELGEATVRFGCPHCKATIKRKVATKIEVEDEKATILIKCHDGICRHCGKGLHMVLCVGVEAMSEHDVRKDSELFRLAERVRRLLKIPI